MTSEYMPRDLSFATASMSEYNSNTVRLEANTPAPAGPSQVIRINLPETMVDLSSFAVFMDVETSASGNVNGKLPADLSFISQVEVSIGGVQIENIQHNLQSSKIGKGVSL